MLPEYEALSCNGIIRKGGHSNPWSVMVQTETGSKSYVVKIYKTLDIEARNKMTAEVIGNFLAGEFDLKAPNAALINFSESFKIGISPECEEILSISDDRIKFGTEELQGNYIFPRDFEKNDAKNYIDLDTLFAFDYLIRNRDRNLQKPNLLLKDKTAWLIDHEMALEIPEDYLTEIECMQWDRRYTNHLFYNYLHNSNKEIKRNYFSTFEEYLNHINLNSLNSYYQQLEQKGFITNRTFINTYFEFIKQNSSKFVNMLRGAFL